MTAQPSWFSSAGLFGWFHVPPDRRVRGGVVICPPLGPEQAWAYATLRSLAERLEGAGFAVLRFDYEGTGESVGDLQRQWPAAGLADSVVQAVDTLSGMGVTNVALVGLRFGATLAGSVALAHGAAALVLWDPLMSGQAFLREQRAANMLRLTLAHDEEDLTSTAAEGSIEIPGFMYGPQGVADLRSVDLAAGGPERPHATLVLARSGLGRRQRADLETTFAPNWMEAVGQEDLLFEKIIPDTSIDQVVSWLDTNLDASVVDVGPLEGQREIEVAAPEWGESISERVETLGPLGLFGIVTESKTVGTGPVVVFLDVAAEPPIGPGRLWVDMARRLARLGVRSARFNCSGLGDSPVRPGQAHDVVYAVEAREDIVDVANALSPEDPSQVVLVGLCSGGYNAVEGGIVLSAVGVCSINPILDAPALDSTIGGVQRLAAQPRRPWLRALSGYRALDAFRFGFPEAGWHLLDRLGLVRSPARGLVPLIERGSKVLVVCGLEDGHKFTRRGGWIVRRLTRSGRFRYDEVPGLDHSLLLREQQLAVSDLVSEHILSLFAPEPGDRAESRSQ